jgi:hypothetical protein
LRTLRLCCVATTELIPQPTYNIDRLANLKRLRAAQSGVDQEMDRACALQAARCCMVLSAQELVNSVAPIFAASEAPTASSSSSSSATFALPPSSSSSSNVMFTSDFSMNPQQYVIIDIRSFEECIVSGGGTIPR